MKNLIVIIIAFMLFAVPIFAQETPVTGQARIRVDLDSVTITVDNILTDLDSFGNPLAKDLWFIVNLPPGEHTFILIHPEYTPYEVTGDLEIGAAFTIDYNFIPAEIIDTTVELEEDYATLILTSDPDSANIFINDRTDLVVAPDTIVYPTGEYNFISEYSGYKELNHIMTLRKDLTYSINFIMQTSQPDPVSAQDLGLEYMESAQLMNAELAKIQQERLMDLTETFMVIPLGQGILARILLGENDRTSANILIGSGLALTAGTFLLSKILIKRKLDNIQEHNKNANEQNKEAQNHNKTVDEQVAAENDRILTTWLEENNGRGEVIVEIVE
jgi:hypothetical protein